MKIKKSRRIWDHVPTIKELRECCDKKTDPVTAEFPDTMDLTIYFRCTGLSISTNGKDKYKTEMKYGIDDSGEVHFPAYKIPAKHEFLLI